MATISERDVATNGVTRDIGASDTIARESRMGIDHALSQ
jgi:hypothetical protein